MPDKIKLNEGGEIAVLNASPWDDGHWDVSVDSHESAAVRLASAQLVAWCRCVLREIVGPSIQDVRDAWTDPSLHVHRYDMVGIPSLDFDGHTYEVEDIDGQAVAPGKPWHHTEAEALRAAYDAAPKREDA